MKSMALLSVGAAAVSALQSPSPYQFAPRDLAGLTSLLQPVTSGLALLTDTTKSYPACGAGGLESSIDDMVGTLTTAEHAINYLKPLTMDEAQGFKDVAMKMSAAGNAFFAVMESKVSLFGQDRICGDLVGYVTNLGDHVSQLMNTVESKFTTRAGASDVRHFADAFRELVGELQACGGGGGAQPAASPPNPYLPPGTMPAPAAAAPGQGAPGPKPLSASAAGPTGAAPPPPGPSASSTAAAAGPGYRTNATASHPGLVATAGAAFDDLPSWMVLAVALAALLV